MGRQGRVRNDSARENYHRQQVLVGKPIVKGTRLAVEFVIDPLGRGWSVDRISARIRPRNAGGHIGLTGLCERSLEIRTCLPDRVRLSSSVVFAHERWNVCLKKAGSRFQAACLWDWSRLRSGSHVCPF